MTATVLPIAMALFSLSLLLNLYRLLRGPDIIDRILGLQHAAEFAAHEAFIVDNEGVERGHCGVGKCLYVRE